MGFRLGDKINVGGVARIGKKVLGETARIGHKIASEGGKAVSLIERVPVLGTAVAPATGVIRSGLGLVQTVSDIAGAGASMIGTAEGVIRKGQEAIRTGDTLDALSVMREGKDLAKAGRTNLERARKVASDSQSLARGSGSAFKQSAKDLRGGVVGSIRGSLSDP